MANYNTFKLNHALWEPEPGIERYDGMPVHCGNCKHSPRLPANQNINQRKCKAKVVDNGDGTVTVTSLCTLHTNIYPKGIIDLPALVEEYEEDDE